MDKTEKIVLCFVGGAAVLAAVSLASMKVEGSTPPVVTLIQNEPVYYENTEIVGFNAEKFSNPETLTRKADISSIVSTTHTHTASLPGERLTKSRGVFNGPSGHETWYSLPMQGVVKIMRQAGYNEKEFPYWVDENGLKRLGKYIMLAGNLDIRPRGTVVMTSWGEGLICDTGSFCQTDKTALDLAVSW